MGKILRHCYIPSAAGTLQDQHLALVQVDVDVLEQPAAVVEAHGHAVGFKQRRHDGKKKKKGDK